MLSLLGIPCFLSRKKDSGVYKALEESPSVVLRVGCHKSTCRGSARFRPPGSSQDSTIGDSRADDVKQIVTAYAQASRERESRPALFAASISATNEEKTRISHLLPMLHQERIIVWIQSQ